MAVVSLQKRTGEKQRFLFVVFFVCVFFLLATKMLNKFIITLDDIILHLFSTLS